MPSPDNKRKCAEEKTVGYYLPKDVPVYGCYPVYPAYCRIDNFDANFDDIEGRDGRTKDCGCGFGKCANGGIL